MKSLLIILSLGLTQAQSARAQEPPVPVKPVAPTVPAQIPATPEAPKAPETNAPPKAIVIEEPEEGVTPGTTTDPVAPVTPVAPIEPIVPKLAAAEDPEKLFQKGFDLGRVGDRPTGSYRRLIQRTVMIGEPQQTHHAILTFDDQILPTDRGHSSAMDIANDLQPRGVRAIFFANVPAVSEKSLDIILRRTSDRAQQKEQVLKLLNSQRTSFVKGLRDLLKIKKGDQFICEVFNHTAFHQNMSRFKKDGERMEMCFVGIRFIEECLQEAYAAERPGIPRLRYFRFPFLAEPRSKEAKAELNTLFTEFGLLSLGETQDSKDFDNGSSTQAYKSLKAAKKGKRYGVKQGPYGIAEQPVALFHTKTWSKIRKGVLGFLDEYPTKAPVKPLKPVPTAPKTTGPDPTAPPLRKLTQ